MKILIKNIALFLFHLFISGLNAQEWQELTIGVLPVN